MTALAATLVGLLLVVLLACVKPLGLYMADIFEGRPIWPLRALGECERGIYRLCGIDPAAQMSWKQYALCLLLFNALGALALYALQRWQAWLPLNPQRFPGVSPGSSFNTAVSFITNTNWQGYSGESTMSYLTQMAGLGAKNLRGKLEPDHRRPRYLVTETGLGYRLRMDEEVPADAAG